MPPKKRNNRQFVPVEKDDGTRWIVIDDNGQQIYGGDGLPKSQASRLSEGLIQSSSIRQVN